MSTQETGWLQFDRAGGARQIDERQGLTMTTQQSHIDAERDAGSYGRVRRTFTETKAGYKTTEFALALVAIVAILIATYADNDDSLSVDDGWRYVAWVAIAYIVSRGLAKLGTREPYTDDLD